MVLWWLLWGSQEYGIISSADDEYQSGVNEGNFTYVVKSYLQTFILPKSLLASHLLSSAHSLSSSQSLQLSSSSSSSPSSSFHVVAVVSRTKRGELPRIGFEVRETKSGVPPGRHNKRHSAKSLTRSSSHLKQIVGSPSPANNNNTLFLGGENFLYFLLPILAVERQQVSTTPNVSHVILLVFPLYVVQLTPATHFQGGHNVISLSTSLSPLQNPCHVSFLVLERKVLGNVVNGFIRFGRWLPFSFHDRVVLVVIIRTTQVIVTFLYLYFLAWLSISPRIKSVIKMIPSRETSSECATAIQYFFCVAIDSESVPRFGRAHPK